MSIEYIAANIAMNEAIRRFAIAQDAYRNGTDYDKDTEAFLAARDAFKAAGAVYDAAFVVERDRVAV